MLQSINIIVIFDNFTFDLTDFMAFFETRMYKA